MACHARDEGRLLAGPGADASHAVQVEGVVVMEEGAAAAEGSRLADAVLLEGCTVGPGATVRGSVLGPGTTVPPLTCAQSIFRSPSKLYSTFSHP